MKKLMWWIFGILCTLIGVYPVIYLIFDGNIGLLSGKSEELLSSFLWQSSFYGHIVPGGVALLIGWLQFSEKLRNRRMNFHRNLGKLYVFTVLVSGLCGVYLGVHANEGIISQSGFVALGIFWLITTYLGFMAVRRGDIAKHRKFMVYSYALCFAAVTLRLWMPILILIFQDNTIAYRTVAWLCWVPNLIVAFFILNKKEVQVAV